MLSYNYKKIIFNEISLDLILPGSLLPFWTTKREFIADD